jgi:acyl carrier protein
MSDQTKSIKDQVIELIADRLSVTVAEVTPEKQFTMDLGADSLDTVELIMECEREFNLAIPDEQAEKLKTVGDVIAFVEANVDTKAKA